MCSSHRCKQTEADALDRKFRRALKTTALPLEYVVEELQPDRKKQETFHVK